MREVIATPAIGGSNPDSTFQRAIAQAFERAARAGQRNPIVVGAIPFDPGEPSCLYVPEEMDWQEREPASGASAAAMPQLAGQRSVPDEAGFKHAVEHAIINFRLSDVRKAVLSVMRELTFADDIDSTPCWPICARKTMTAISFACLCPVAAHWSVSARNS
ncbi:isochorismate synthase [Brucella canis HSK A52141]|nr:isochorismate synthase [Brucella canis HSK A52141]